MEAARNLRVRSSQDGGVVSCQSELVGTHSQWRLSRRAVGGRRVILVFGAAGQLGRELTCASATRTAPLAALSRAEADIADATAVRAAISRYKPSLVVNAAAYTKVDAAESET